MTFHLVGVTVGDEAISGSDSAYVYGAMNNIHTSLTSIGLVSTRVTTIVSTKILGISKPPSAGAYSKEALVSMNNVAAFLSGTGAPLMLDVYPFFAFAEDPEHISFEYATFRSKQPVLDGT
ncbi:hypothetical protein REPUB_Repub02eG0093900 [Reevesia pubescens]